MAEEKKKKKLKTSVRKKILDILIVVCIGVAVFSGYNLYKQMKAKTVSKNEVANLIEEAVKRPASSDTSSASTEETVEEETVIDFDYLKSVNEDVCGWITLPDSGIDYPVVFGASTNPNRYGNVFYLRHLFTTGEYNDNGTIFIDTTNGRDFTDKVIAMYGHHNFDHTMFGDLQNYEDQSYYESHKVIHFYTPEGNYELYPVAGKRGTGTSGYIQFYFENDDAFLEYINSFLSESTFTSEETITAGDQVMLLSTCSYHVDDGRYAVICKMVKVQEEAENADNS